MKKEQDVTHREKTKNAYKNLVLRPYGNKVHGRLHHRWKNNIKMHNFFEGYFTMLSISQTI
jgi:hypothetical protein